MAIIRISSLFLLIQTLLFRADFNSTGKLSRKYKGFPCILPQTCTVIPTTNIPHQSAMFVIVNEPTWRHDYHPKSAVYIKVQSWFIYSSFFCAFLGFHPESFSFLSFWVPALSFQTNFLSLQSNFPLFFSTSVFLGSFFFFFKFNLLFLVRELVQISWTYVSRNRKDCVFCSDTAIFNYKAASCYNTLHLSCPSFIPRPRPFKLWVSVKYCWVHLYFLWTMSLFWNYLQCC